MDVVGKRVGETYDQTRNKRKSVFVAYLLWLFLGIFAAHRLYLRRHGWLQLLSVLCFGVGLIWVLLDLFLIPGAVKRSRESDGVDDGLASFWRVLSGAIVGVLGIGFLATYLDPTALEESSNASGAVQPQGEGRSTELGPARPPTDIYIDFGQTVEGRRTSATILGVSTKNWTGTWVLDQLIGETAQPGAVFVIVDYDYTNISDGPIGSFNSPTVTLISPAGVEYKADTGATGSEKSGRAIEENVFSDLNPLITYRSVEVFEIATQLLEQPGWNIKLKLDQGEYYVRIR